MIAVFTLLIVFVEKTHIVLEEFVSELRRGRKYTRREVSNMLSRNTTCKGRIEKFREEGVMTCS